MAILSNAFSTFVAIGNREDLIDVITNISPVEAWFTSNTGSGRATNRYHEWQTDALAAAAANAQVEGNSFAATLRSPTTRTGNYCQILSKTIAITDTQEAVSHAGRDSEIAYQTALSMKELANDIEYALIVNTSAVSGITGTARQLKGVLGWISTNSTTAATGSTTAALSETVFNDNLQLIWAQGGKPQNVLVGAFNKRKISAFTANSNTRNVDASGKTLIASVDVYDSDFGRLFIRTHHILNSAAAGTVIILGDLSLWQKAWLRPIKKENVARTAAATMVHVEAELTLESRQEAGSGKITNTQSA